MVQRSVLSVILLGLVSANVIQAGVLPLGLFQNENLPNFINLLDMPKIGQYSHDFASSAASAATTALGGFKSYMNDFRHGLGGLNIPPQYTYLHRFINGGILPSLTSPAFLNGAADTVTDAIASGIIPNSGLIRPGLLGRSLYGNYGLGNYGLGNYGLGNYGTGNYGSLGGGTSSAATSSSAAA